MPCHIYVFFYSVLVVIVGICYKAYLGEPAQSTAEPANLANASITAYFLVAAAPHNVLPNIYLGYLLAGLAWAHLSPRRPRNQ